MYGFAEATGALVLASLGQIASLIGLRGFAAITASEDFVTKTNEQTWPAVLYYSGHNFIRIFVSKYLPCVIQILAILTKFYVKIAWV